MSICMGRTTLDIDEELFERAREATGIETKSDLVREGLRALIQRAAYLRLAALGGVDPRAKAPPRRRPVGRPRDPR